MRFGDGSVVESCGCGTVSYIGCNGKHHVLQKVYFILKLRSNIVSQLDEEGCMSQLYDGFLSVFDRRGELLAKVPRSRNRLYPLCLKKLVSLLPNLKQQLEPGERGQH